MPPKIIIPGIAPTPPAVPTATIATPLGPDPGLVISLPLPLALPLLRAGAVGPIVVMAAREATAAAARSAIGIPVGIEMVSATAADALLVQMAEAETGRGKVTEAKRREIKTEIGIETEMETEIGGETGTSGIEVNHVVMLGHPNESREETHQGLRTNTYRLREIPGTTEIETETETETERMQVVSKSETATGK